MTATPAGYTRVTWDGLTDYPGETSRIYSGPLACERIAFIVNRQEPGGTGPMHAHDDAEEIYVLLRGRGQLRVDEETIEMRPLDAVRVAPRFEHTTSNPYDKDAWWLVMASPPDEFIAWDPVAYGPPDLAG
jgi:oxalate decarboxylase/phosphoglucose isomerase-like protein (cupin superfamily)